MGRLAPLALLAATVLPGLLCGCSDQKLSLGERCETNSQCPAPLACRIGHCRKECNTTRDCAAGLSCVRDKQDLGACQLPPERSCTRDSDCIEGLVCRLRQCVNECAANIDCPAGARCLPDDATGLLGCVDMAEQACVRASECAVFEGREQVCAVDGRCRDECRGSRDCRYGTSCCGDLVCRADCGDAGVQVDAGADAALDAGMDAGPSVGPLTHLWSVSHGGTAADEAFAVATDDSGNVYVTGAFGSGTGGGSTDLGGAPMVSAGSQDGFIASYDSTGAYRWSQRFGGTGPERANDVVVFGTTVVIVGFTQSSSIDLGAGAMTGETTWGDGFVAAFDTGGAPQWSKRLGAAGLDEVYGVTADATGNVYLTGYMERTVDFGGTPVVSTGRAAFVVSYDSGGAHRWSQAFSSTVALGAGVATSASGLVAVAGNYRGSIDFGGGPIPSNNADVFLAVFDAASGAHAWSRAFGGPNRDAGVGVTMDALGSTTLTSSIDGPVDFGGGSLSGTGERLGVASFDATGAHRWSRALAVHAVPSSSIGSWPGVTSDGIGNVYVTGAFMGTPDLGTGALSNAGFDDVFVVSFAPDGSTRWAASFGGASADYGHGLSVAATGSVSLLATFEGVAAFGGDPLMSAGSSDFVVARYAQPSM